MLLPDGTADRGFMQEQAGGRCDQEAAQSKGHAECFARASGRRRGY
jgi:hypothetical protein